MLTSNVVLPFAGTIADVTAMDRFVLCDGNNGTPDLQDYFVRGVQNVATNPGSTGGASTHTHLGSSHTHTVVHHTHTFTTDTTNANPDGRRSGSKQPRDGHSHTGTTSTTSGSVTGSFTYGAYSNNPPYYAVLFIMATDYTRMPNKALVMRDDTDTRTGFYFCDGGNGTPDLRNKYLRGASAGQDSGATGGSYTHTHSLAHTHTASHSHTGSISQGVGSAIGTDGDQNASQYNHSHSIALNSVTDTLTNPTESYAQLDTGGNNVEPAHYALSIIENLSGGEELPKAGDIFMWFESLEDIPPNYTLCDGSDGTPNLIARFVKQASVQGSHSSGGSDSHGHPSVSHSHVVSGTHRHSGSAYGTPNNTTTSVHNDGYGMYNGHGHGINQNNVSYSAVSYTSANTTAGTSTCLPIYRGAAYIRYDFAPGSNSFIMG